MLHIRIVLLKSVSSRALLVACAACLGATAAPARPLATLRAEGYELRRTLPLRGDYLGCRRHQSLALAGGGLFWCETDSWRYVARPSLRLLDNPLTGDRVLLIGGDEELVGTLEHVPGLPPRLRVATGDTAPVPKPDFPPFVESGALLADQPILPTMPSIPALDRAEPPIAPWHDDGQPRRDTGGRRAPEAIEGR